MKQLLLRAASIFGVVSLLRYIHTNGLTIILYHGVAPKQDESVSQATIYNYRKKFIRSEHFEKQLAYLKEHYAILPLEEAFTRLQEDTLPPHALAITFDDGYENNFLYAYPILKRMELPATFFVTTDFVFGKKPLWVDRLEYACGVNAGIRRENETTDDELRNALKKLRVEEKEERLQRLESETRALVDFEGERRVYAPLSEAQMKGMERDGMNIGAHTQTHPILSRIPSEEARSEIVGSKLTLEQQGFSISPLFAYPNGQPGDWSEKTEQLAREAGFGGALTTIQGINTKTTHPYRLRRIALDGTDDDMHAFAAIVSGVRLYLSWVKRLLFR